MSARDGDPWHAGRCRACGSGHFPARSRCPRCWSEQIDACHLDQAGHLETFTTVHRAIGEREVPYTVGWAIFPSCGVRVFGVVRTGEPRADVGDAVWFVRQHGEAPPYVLAAGGPIVAGHPARRAP